MTHHPRMDLVLQSERLTLTPFDDCDVDIAIENFTNPEVLRFAGGAMPEDEIRGQMPNWTRRGGDGCIGVWCVAERDSGEKLGSGALLPMPIEETHTDYELVVSGQLPSADLGRVALSP